MAEVSRADETTKPAVVRVCSAELLDASEEEENAPSKLAMHLAGTLKGLPSDLATNSKHMDAFGR